MSVLHWDNKNFETDTGLASPFYLSIDSNVSPNNLLNTDFTFVPEGVLIKCVCQAHYFPNFGSIGGDAGSSALRLLAQARVELCRTSMKFAPPEIKPLARGRAVAVNVGQNFGDLIDDASSNTVLDKCWLHDAQVIDGQFIEGVKLQLTFARVSNACAP